MQQSGGPEENKVHFRFLFEHNRVKPYHKIIHFWLIGASLV